MPRYHINPETGQPGPCRARVACPFGDLNKDHYSTPQEAEEAYGEKMKEQLLTSFSKLSSEGKLKAVEYVSSRSTSQIGNTKDSSKQQTSSAPPHIPTEIISFDHAMKKRVVICGASDDLVEISGVQFDEYNADFGRPTTLVLSNGDRVKMTYDDDGIWKFGKGPAGSQLFKAPEEIDPNNADHDDKYGLPTYSQRLVLPEGVSVVRMVKKRR